MAEYANTGVAAIGNAKQTATVTFEAEQTLPIKIEKSVDRPDEVYFEGESITLTVDLTRTTSKTINNLTLTDIIPAVVDFDPSSGITISGPHGSIHFDADSRVLTISNLTLNDNNPVTTVTVTGEIRFT